jgi:hypothetical protein
MAEVTLQNISKIYDDVDNKRGRKKAVDDISFTDHDKSKHKWEMCFITSGFSFLYSLNIGIFNTSN